MPPTKIIDAFIGTGERVVDSKKGKRKNRMEGEVGKEREGRKGERKGGRKKRERGKEEGGKKK